jgi:hypothetical protein
LNYTPAIVHNTHIINNKSQEIQEATIENLKKTSTSTFAFTFDGLTVDGRCLPGVGILFRIRRRGIFFW